MRWLYPIAAVLLLSGCSSFLAERIVHTPNHGRVFSIEDAPSRAEREILDLDGFLRVPVGPPDASLAVWLFEPTDTPRGTILVIHGFEGGPLGVHGKAKNLRRAGYRVAVVTLRGYSDSSGDFRTFGVVERNDLVQVVDALEAQGLLAGDLGVWGLSYGAAMALEHAGIDPRVRAVVAVAGFSSMREVTPHYMRMFLPVIGWVKSDAEFQRLIDEAGAIAGFDPDDASARAAIARTEAPVLLVHGEWDALVPFTHSERLQAAARGHCELVALPVTGHLGAWADGTGTIMRHSRAWFERWLRPNHGGGSAAP